MKREIKRSEDPNPRWPMQSYSPTHIYSDKKYHEMQLQNYHFFVCLFVSTISNNRIQWKS